MYYVYKKLPSYNVISKFKYGEKKGDFTIEKRY